MRIVYLVSSGASDPTTASVPIHLAVNGSLEVGQEPVIVLAGHGADIVIGKNPETLEGLGVPPMRELLEKVRDHQVPVYV